MRLWSWKRKPGPAHWSRSCPRHPAQCPSNLPRLQSQNRQTRSTHHPPNLLADKPIRFFLLRKRVQDREPDLTQVAESSKSNFGDKTASPRVHLTVFWPTSS